MTTNKDSSKHDIYIKRSLEETKNVLKELKKKEGELSRIPSYEEYWFVFFREPLLQERRHITKTLPFVWYGQESGISLSSPQIWEKKLELLKSLDTLQTYFDDPIERHIQYFRFKEELKELRNTVDSKYWDFLRLIVGCIDAITNTESENLNLSQIEAFRKVVKEIEEDIDCPRVNSLLGTLISAGLKPVPPLKNLESIEG